MLLVVSYFSSLPFIATAKSAAFIKKPFIMALPHLTEFIVFTIYDWIIATTDAGVIVNGGSALRYVKNTVIPFFSKCRGIAPTFGLQEGQAVLQKARERGDFSPLDDAGVKRVINTHSDNPNSIYNSWFTNDGARIVAGTPQLVLAV